MTAGALHGIRVVEAGGSIPVAWCARQFATWGGDVVVAEPEGGAALRREPPFAPDGESLLWRYVSAGKRSAVGDPAALVAQADVVVCESPPDAPREAVVVSITPFGLSGPYASLRGEDVVVQALSGYMSLNGDAGGEPLRAPGNLLAYACGVSAFVGALAALRERDANGGEGQVVEVSCLEAIASFVPSLRPQYTRKPTVRDGGPATGVRLMRCADGWISLNPLPSWRPLLDALLVLDVDVPADLTPPRDLAGARDLIAPYVAQVGAQALEDALRTVDRGQAIFPRLVEAAELPRHPQLVARSYFSQLGGAPCAGPAAKLTATPAAAPRALEAFTGWAERGRAGAPPRQAGEGPPLAGVRVVDLTQAWIGPYASQLLADLGADVVKVESHRRPDVWRYWNRPKAPAIARAGAHPGNTNVNFNSVNRNKRSLCLDLKTDDGRAVFLDLVARADIVMENYTSGTLADLGVDYDALREAKPDVVVVSFSGYGSTGPLAGLTANGVAIETVAGWDALHGVAGGPPMHMGFYQADALSGLHMAAVTLAALRHRDRTGEGQHADGSMLEAAAGYVGEEVMHAVLGGAAERLGNTRRGWAAHGVVLCGDGEWLAVASRDPVALEGLDALTAREAMDVLQSRGVAAGVVLAPEETLDDEHFVARGWFREMAHADMGTHRYAGFPWRFSRSKLAARTASPRLGEDGPEVLRSELGMDDQRIAALVAAGVTGTIVEATTEDDDGLQPDPG